MQRGWSVRGWGCCRLPPHSAALEKAIVERRTQVAVLDIDWDLFLKGRVGADRALFAELQSREPVKTETKAMSIHEVC